jgi:DNA-binding CsgD family transcriptional regulator
MNDADIYARLSNLTPKQAVVLRVVLDTASIEQAATILKCSVGNVKFHMTAVYKLLGITKDSKGSLIQLLFMLLDMKPRTVTRRVINERVAARQWRRSPANPQYLSFAYPPPTPEHVGE